jgi:hypothetical protein
VLRGYLHAVIPVNDTVADRVTVGRRSEPCNLRTLFALVCLGDPFRVPVRRRRRRRCDRDPDELLRVTALPELTGLKRRSFRARSGATLDVAVSVRVMLGIEAFAGTVQRLNPVGRHPRARKAEDSPLLVRRLFVVWRAFHAILPGYLPDMD